MRHSTDLLRRETGALVHRAAQAARARAVGRAAPAARGRAGRHGRALRLRGAGAPRPRRRAPAARPGGPAGRRAVGGRRRQGAARRLPRRDRDRRPRRGGRPPAAARRARCAAHVDACSGKAYWRALPGAPEFVVLFVPAESFLAAALETDPALLAYAAGARRRARHPDHADRPAAHRRPRLDHRGPRRAHPRDPRARPRAAHPARRRWAATSTRSAARSRGPSRPTTARSGSMESRVLVTARQFERHRRHPRVARPGRSRSSRSPRPLTAAELLDAVAEQRPELPANLPGGRPPASRADRAPDGGLPCGL